MDPITAVGAASSVIGIAAFAIELCEVLHEFGGQVRGAREGLIAVGSSIESTADSLRLIHQYLEMEADNLASGTSTRLFSNDALVFVKSNADRCLLVFWRIEAVLLNNADGEVEEHLRRRLDDFNAGAVAGRADKVTIQPSLVPASLPLLKRLRWPFVTAKLSEYRSQLQFHHQCLSLIVMTVFIGEVRSKPNLENKDVNAIAKAAIDIAKASREVKNIVRTVASIRDMLQEGDIDLRVLFPPRDPKPPPDYQSTTGAHDSGMKIVPQEPGKDPENGAELGLTSDDQSTKSAMRMHREPDVGASSLDDLQDGIRDSPSPSQTTGKLPLSSDILNMNQQANPGPGQSASGLEDDGLGSRNSPHKQDMPNFGPFLRPVAGGAGGSSHRQGPQQPLGGDPVSTSGAFSGSSVQSPHTPATTEPGHDSDREEEEDAAGGETNGSSDDHGTASGDLLEETTPSFELGFRKYQNGPVAQYVIKRQGAFFALEQAPLGALRRAIEALRWWWWPSREAMQRTLASATEEQLTTLGRLLQPRGEDDGEILNRALLRVKEVGKRPRHTGRSDDPYGDGGGDGTALLALVEILPREEFASISKKDEKKSAANAGQQGAWVQDLSTPSGHHPDLVDLLTTHHVWKIQPQGSNSVTDSSTSDWTRCLITRGKMSEEEVVRLRGPMDGNDAQEKQPQDQYLGLTPNQKLQVDRLIEQLQAETAATDFAYSVEKIEIVRTDKPQGILRGLRQGSARAGEISSLLIFSVRAPREGADLKKLQKTEKRRRKAELRRPGLPVVHSPKKWRSINQMRVDLDEFADFPTGGDQEPEGERGFEAPRSPVGSNMDATLREYGQGRKKGSGLLRSGPTHTRMYSRDLELETLRALSIDFEVDTDDPDHIIIKRLVDEDEQERLLAHTRAIREARQAGDDAGPSTEDATVHATPSTSSRGEQKRPVSEHRFPRARPSSLSASVGLGRTLPGSMPISRMPSISVHRGVESISIGGERGGSQGGSGRGKDGEWANADHAGASDDEDDDDLVERLLARWTPAGAEEPATSADDVD